MAEAAGKTPTEKPAAKPSGAVKATVLDVQQKDVDMFQEARLDPAVDFDRLEVVLVITNFLPTKLE
jgi:cell shape-determining protein MreC